MARILLTRELAPDDPHRLRLEAAGHTVLAISMLEFETLPFSIHNEVDWLFAYSRQAVRAVIVAEVLATAFRQNPTLQIAAVGAGTAREWQAAGVNVDFTGDGSPKEVAQQFAEVAAGQRVAFLQAEQSRQSIQTFLLGRVEAETVVCYRAVPAQKSVPKPIDLYMLTSPRNAALALAGIATDGNRKIYCIGGPTAEMVEALGFAVTGVAARAEIGDLLGLA